LRCEVCGRRIHGEPIRSLIEGAKLTVCHECSEHGTIIYEEPKPKPAVAVVRGTRLPVTLHVKKPPEVTVDTSIELVEGYGDKIRQAREKIGLSHDDLGKKLNEKVSLLRKIETGKMTPNNKLATKLEHILKIKLIVPASEEKMPKTKIPRTESREMTLGDLIQIGDENRKKEETRARKPS
jgi:putative transcription factor